MGKAKRAHHSEQWLLRNGKHGASAPWPTLRANLTYSAHQTHRPHPEETAKRSSRRMAADEIGASWFSRGCEASSGDGASRLLTHEGRLLRRDLARRGRRVDEVGGELGVAGLGVLHRLLLDRAVAADAI